MSETDQMVADAEAADILRGIDNFMLRVHSLYDIGRAIPHPYDAVGDYAKLLLHDYANWAFTVEGYVERTQKRVRDETVD